jgi:hypothetical protein
VPKRYLEYREKTCVFNITNNTRLGILTIVVLLVYIMCIYSGVAAFSFHQLKENFTFVWAERTNCQDSTIITEHELSSV